MKSFFHRFYPYGFFYTFRGWLLILLLAFFLLGPVRNSFDITATGLSLSFFSIILFFSILSLINFRNLKNKLKLENIVIESELTSQKDFVMKIVLSDWKPYVFFNVYAKVTFKNSNYETAEERVYEDQHKLSCLTLINFPHRGAWQIDKITLSYQDTLSLINLKFNLPSTYKFKVMPKPGAVNAPLPIISSSYREGDAAYSQYERSGDPYELKQYDPSDGIKKLSWKIYARTGELVSRYNETSFTPEGEVLVYLELGRLDDEVCSIGLNYIDQLQKAGLDYSCFHSGSNEVISNNLELLAESLLTSVWKAGSGSSHAEVFKSFLSQNSKRRYNKAVIFCKADAPVKELLDIGRYFSGLSISPYFFVLYDKAIQDQKTKEVSALTAAAKYWFSDAGSTSKVAARHPKTKNLRAFALESLKEGWSVEERNY